MSSVPLVPMIGARSRDFGRNWAVILTFLSLPVPFLALAWLAFRFAMM